jgi:hypothetical protein
MQNLMTREAILDTIVIEDVTDNPIKLEQAFGLVADAYAPQAAHVLSLQDVYQELCNDDYRYSGRVRYFMASGYNPNTGRIEVLGTIRLLLAKLGNRPSTLPALEAMQLLCPAGGWQTFTYNEFDINKAFELGRFAISKAYRSGVAREMGLYVELTHRLIAYAFMTAQRKYHKTQGWAVIMRPQVQGLLETAGIHLQAAPGMELNVQGNADLFERFGRTWQANTPCFYQISL